MAAELVARTSQLRFLSIYAQRSEQLCTRIAGELFQLTTQGRRVLVICKVRNRQPRGNYTKPPIKGSKLAQKRLEGRLPQPSFLGAGRILQRFQTVQHQQGSTAGDKFRESPPFSHGVPIFGSGSPNQVR